MIEINDRFLKREGELKICILNIYIIDGNGKFPDTFPLWVQSVKNNPSIDFIMITNKEVDNLPKNIKLVYMNLSDIKSLAQNKLGMEIVLEKPYKLCDYKPVYGKIFEDLLHDYDYWGHCDIDLVFGDIRSFLEKFHLEKYDKFFNEGHLSLYRNTEQVNNAYMLPGSYYGYKEVFSNDQNYVFDENNRINSIFKTNGLKLYEGTLYANINPAFTRFRTCRLKNKWNQIFLYGNGKIWRYKIVFGKIIKEEFIYIHLLKRKLGAPLFDVNLVEKYLIDDKGYHPITVEPNIEFIKKELKRFSRWREMKEWIINFYNHRLKLSSIKRQLVLLLWEKTWGRKLLSAIKKK